MRTPVCRLCRYQGIWAKHLYPARGVRPTLFQTRKKEDETVLLFCCLNEVKRMRPAAVAARMGCCLQP